MKLFTFALAALITLSTAAFAGEQYLDQTGFAVSGYDVVAYRSLTQSPLGTPQPEGVPGRADITAEYNGAKFAFATAENRETFLSDPEKFLPQYDGHCAYGVSKGGKVPGNPNLWRIVDDKLYLNITKNVVGFWEEDIPGNISLANNNWVDLDALSPSDRAVPDFTSSAPVAN